MLSLDAIWWRTNITVDTEHGAVTDQIVGGVNLMKRKFGLFVR